MNDVDRDLDGLDVQGSTKGFLDSIDKALEQYYGCQERAKVANLETKTQQPTANQIKWRRERIRRILRDQGKLLAKPIHQKDQYGGYTLDPNGPTDYAPGTEGKMRVLEDRAKRGVALFHPDDCSLNYSMIELNVRRESAIGPKRNSKRKQA